MVTHKVVNPERANELPELNPVIREYLEQEDEIHARAQQEIADFEAAFEIEQVQEDENAVKK